MTETFHGVKIPEEIWLSWNDPNAEDVGGFRLGVQAALGIDRNSSWNQAECDRLEDLAEARDDAVQAAFEEKHKDEPWMQRRIAFRESMQKKYDQGEKTDG